jgi:hypothetical protein
LLVSLKFTGVKNTVSGGIEVHRCEGHLLLVALKFTGVKDAVAGGIEVHRCE